MIIIFYTSYLLVVRCMPTSVEFWHHWLLKLLMRKGNFRLSLSDVFCDQVSTGV